MKSGRLYSLVTKSWPRIATGLVVAIGLAELVAGGLTAGSSLELYLTVWAATTGGLWFLFEKAEAATSGTLKQKVAGWITHRDPAEGIWSIPEQFSDLFDNAFGSRHLSFRCFAGSAVASIVSVLVLLGLWLTLFWPIESLAYVPLDGRFQRLITSVDLASLVDEGVAVAVLFAVLINVLPDYVSLLQTRIVLGWLSKGGHLAKGLGLDLLLTTTLSAVAVIGVSKVTINLQAGPEAVVRMTTLDPAYGIPEILGVSHRQTTAAPDTARADVRALEARGMEALSRCEAHVASSECEFTAYYSFDDDFTFKPLTSFPEGLWEQTTFHEEIAVPLGIFFYSAFFTSAWLWLYAASVLISHILLKMNNGLGFLLRVTDVQEHPFRSVGFVSVLIVSGLFALGLPFVLF